MWYFGFVCYYLRNQHLKAPSESAGRFISGFLQEFANVGLARFHLAASHALLLAWLDLDISKSINSSSQQIPKAGMENNLFCMENPLFWPKFVIILPVAISS